MAAPPASATPARCLPTFKRASTSTGWSPSAYSQRQSQLRGPRKRGRARKLPDEPAAGGGLRPGRQDRPQLRDRSAGQGRSRQAGLPQGHLADASRGGRGHRERPQQRELPQGVRHGLPTATPTGRASSFPTGDVYQWEPDSTYIRQAPYFDGITKTPAPVTDILGARVLAVLGDSVTTDHISPGGQHQGQRPGGKISRRSWRQAGGLQQLRLAARQP